MESEIFWKIKFISVYFLKKSEVALPVRVSVAAVFVSYYKGVLLET